MRNNDLLQEKREVSKGQHSEISTSLTSSTPNLLPKKNFMAGKSREKKANILINLNNIYKLIQKGFDYIAENDKESTGNFQESLHNINSMLNRSNKALTQMKIIEMSYTYLFYYKENNIQKHQKFFEKIMYQLDLEHKRLKSEKYKKEEKERALEMYKKYEAKKDKIIFKPRHQDIYSNLIYIEKIRKEEKRKNKNAKKEIDIYDFLYDIDEEKEEEYSLTSVRIDALLSKIYKISREDAKNLVTKEAVFVNGRPLSKPEYEPKEGEIIIARTLGRFTYLGKQRENKKGKNVILIKR